MESGWLSRDRLPWKLHSSAPLYSTVSLLRGGAEQKRTLTLLTGRKAGGRRRAAPPVFTSAAQAAVVTGLAVDTTGFAPHGGGVAVVHLNGIVHGRQVGRGCVCRGSLKVNKMME